MDEKTNIKLTSAEIANLWTAYSTDGMSKCMLQYFLSKVEDPEVRPVIQYALELTSTHLQYITRIFEEEQFPVPHAFSEKDVNIEAPRLFSDNFFLLYIFNMAKAGLLFYSIALPTTARSDVRTFFSDNIHSTTDLFNKAIEVNLSKGIHIRAPFIPYPEAPEYVHKQSFLNGFFGDRRPVTSMEISHLYINMLTNTMGLSLTIGFSQVATQSAIKDYMAKGKEIAKNHINTLASSLADDDVPAPVGWDVHVTDSTTPPFSDKLMLYHIIGLAATGMQNYGSALAASPRRDIAAQYARLIAQSGKYAEDGTHILIDQGWMEKLPGTVDREALATT
jgi:hypothetical protein